jgi:hypothetical protein
VSLSHSNDHELSPIDRFSPLANNLNNFTKRSLHPTISILSNNNSNPETENNNLTAISTTEDQYDWLDRPPIGECGVCMFCICFCETI